jgi:hypothetical protein
MAVAYFDFSAAVQQAEDALQPDQTAMIAQLDWIKARLASLQDDLTFVLDNARAGCKCAQVDGNYMQGTINRSKCPFHRRPA